MNDQRRYPDRPYLAVSAAIIRDRRVLLVRRAGGPGRGLFSLPGGVVELGETLEEAVVREASEETGLRIEPIALAGYRQYISKDAQGRVERHYVILAFVARAEDGEPVLNGELAEYRWVEPREIEALSTTEGLAAIVKMAFELLE